MTVRLDVWPPLPPQAHLRRAGAALPFPLGEPGVVLLSRARHGLYLGVRALGLGPGDEVLVPAYHHGSEVEALVRAGLAVRFYEARESLAPDPGELDGMLGPRTRALHLIHYLGFPQDARCWRHWCDERGLLLIEDAAQAPRQPLVRLHEVHAPDGAVPVEVLGMLGGEVQRDER
jgi:dTDP-4-amino-4,6-dideoxygalactose transaminase